MNKQEFLETLRECLAPMPSQEREELLLDYDSHFRYGTENGRTEEETARMLGDPVALAKEILGPGFVSQPPGRRKPDVARMIGVTIALFFLNLVAVPLLVSLWAVFVSLCAVAVAGCLSPVLLLIQHLMYGDVTPAKAFLAIGSTGVGMLFAFFVRYYALYWMVSLTLGYAGWTARTWSGRN